MDNETLNISDVVLNEAQMYHLLYGVAVMMENTGHEVCSFDLVEYCVDCFGRLDMNMLCAIRRLKDEYKVGR